MTGLHEQRDRGLAGPGRPLRFIAQGGCPRAEGWEVAVTQASVHWCEAPIYHSAAMTDREKPEDRSSSTILHLPKESSSRSGCFIQRLKSFSLSSSHHCQKLRMLLCVKNQLCFTPQIIKIKQKLLHLKKKKLKTCGLKISWRHTNLKNGFSTWQEFRKLVCLYRYLQSLHPFTKH